MSRINYERSSIPYHDRQLKLDRMRQLLTRLGNPDAGMKIVHVAGTKGKGSTAAMIAAVLTSAGYRTGLFSSPHLERIEERFAIDGQPCAGDEFVSLVERMRPLAAAMDHEAALEGNPDDGPTYFELTTALALVLFADARVDATVLEVGLGGRLDSTNVCLPAVSVITSISHDHTRQLGDTLTEIAREKAGIIKPGVPVVSGVTAPEPSRVIAAVAREHGCRLIQLGRDFQYNYEPGEIPPHPDNGTLGPRYGTIDWQSNLDGTLCRLKGVRLPMLGRHQAANAAVALTTCAELVRQGWSLSEQTLTHGLSAVQLPARIEFLPGSPAVILDTAHNVASAAALVEALAEALPRRPRWLMLSVSHDKDVAGIVRVLAPHFERFCVTAYQENPRAVPPERLAALLADQLDGPDQRIDIEPTPLAAWNHIRQQAAAEDLVCIAGSFFLAAEMRPLVCP